jgi:hypothetical protein
MEVLEEKEEKRKNKPKALTVKDLRVKIRLWKTFLKATFYDLENGRFEH